MIVRNAIGFGGGLTDVNPITSLAYSVYSNSRIDLTWTNNDTYTSIKIYSSLDNVTFVLVDTIGLTDNYSATGLSANYYYFKVLGIKGTRDGGYSNTVNNTVPLILYDGNTLFSDFTDESKITKVGSAVSEVTPVFGTHPYKQTGADSVKPSWSSEGLTFDGSNDEMHTDAFTLNNPVEFYDVVKFTGWTDNDWAFDGLNGATAGLRQTGTTPAIESYNYSGGNYRQTISPNLTLNTYGIIRRKYYGQSSVAQLNNEVKNVGAMANLALGGLSIGRMGTSGTGYGAFVSKGQLIRTIDDTVYNRRDINNYLVNKYSVGSTESFVNTGQFDNGKIVFSFDDGASSMYTQMKSIFDAQGIKSTLYITTGTVGTTNYLTWAQIQELYAAGYDIQCHSSDASSLNQLTTAQINTKLDAVNSAFTTNSLPTPTMHAYPSGHYSKTAIEAVNAYRTSARATTGKIEDFIPIYTNTDKRFLSSVWIDNISSDTKTKLKTIMDNAKTNKSAVFCFAHNIAVSGSANAISISDINELIDYAQSIGLDIITHSQLSALMA